MKTKKRSAAVIAKFINENVSLSGNDVVSIYEGPNGLTYTRGSEAKVYSSVFQFTTGHYQIIDEN